MDYHFISLPFNFEVLVYAWRSLYQVSSFFLLPDEAIKKDKLENVEIKFPVLLFLNYNGYLLREFDKLPTWVSLTQQLTRLTYFSLCHYYSW